MLLRRRLLLGLLSVCSLLFFYILCVNVQRPWPSSLKPLKRLTVFTLGESRNSQDSEEPLYNDRESNRENNWLPNPASTMTPGAQQTPSPQDTKHKPAGDNNVPGVLKSDDGAGEPGQPGSTRVSIKGRTTVPPYIGDSYMTEDFPLQTHCPDSIRRRVAQTEFREEFLKNVPVLQWAQHVTPENHLRLSKYPGSHGWGEMDYPTLVETLSVLNSSANWQMFDDWKDRSKNSECIRCAVVGNGGILNNSKKGEEIDSHHYVFRTNGAITKGFEQDVGSRTTHYTFSTNTLKNSYGNYRRFGYTGPPLSKETRYIFLPDHDRDYLMVKAVAKHTLVERGKEQGKDPTKFFGEDVSIEKLKMYHPDFIRYIRNRFLPSNTRRRNYPRLYRPSTGAVMLLAALHTCDKVSAYGFMTPDYIKYSDHYYDPVYSRVHFYANHDMQLEKVVWQQLHQAGLMRLFMRE
ncbi:alpha-N-acetylgalactosaminide alpha-2,6-sialyltransferase 2 [Labrus bergylta]|uniref:alpha-N-acetylgalactosaminide alpha-2,6-sialyltransferase n=1 Tax=Labrus bergylta TaxID=56723 RepID=A0A3Q3EYH5_9LABR|nr:alpha-N-acetylgalactosaminide alpha-2,6-sialyltransferase 2-like [Labrus bergylta]XP_020506184.1 alpha-N-acetylgalactosaminide alpha-2,6-sialyltransferase 2-like [Labrus bergylta]